MSDATRVRHDVATTGLAWHRSNTVLPSSTPKPKAGYGRRITPAVFFGHRVCVPRFLTSRAPPCRDGFSADRNAKPESLEKALNAHQVQLQYVRQFTPTTTRPRTNRSISTSSHDHTPTLRRLPAGKTAMSLNAILPVAAIIVGAILFFAGGRDSKPTSVALAQLPPGPPPGSHGTAK
jgi:hypothetical protein